MTSSADTPQDPTKTSKWQEILNYEKKEIERGREDLRNAEHRDDSINANELDQKDGSPGFVGLAFSGGGIRSATFNLGVIQALAELRLLRKIDYLSTVSGGGYIGSWLTSWMASHDQSAPKGLQETDTPPSLPTAGNFLGNVVKQAQRIWESHDKKDDKCKSILDIENELAPVDKNNKPVLAAGNQEPLALRHLRSYTDYLKPHGGLFSLDSMTAFTTWLRNSLLNQSILIAAFGAFLLLPLALGSTVKNIIYSPLFSDNNSNFIENVIPFSEHSVLWFMASFCLAVAIGFINVNILYKPTIVKPKLPWYSSKKAVSLLILLPLVVCSFLLTIMLPSLHQLVVCADGYIELMKTMLQFSLWPLTPSALFYWMLVFCGIAFVISSPLRLLFFDSTNRRDSSVFLYGSIFVIAAVFGLLLLTKIAQLLVSHTPTPFSSAVIVNILTFGPPLILATFALAVFVYVGLLGREFDEHQREWWSRLVALVSFAAIGWLVLFGISIWGSLAVDYFRIGLVSMIAWLGASGIGAALGKSAAISTIHESKGANKWLSIAAQIAPYIFIFGLCLFVAYLLNTSLLYILGKEELIRITLESGVGNFTTTYFLRLYQFKQIFSIPGWHLILAAMVLFFIGALFSWRANINTFSFHNFYRNRLTRAYLAAGIAAKERDKAKLPLTGMNDMDSPRLDRLPSRPYHILNTALNITSGKHLSWQERKAASFFFSKGYCGYFLQGGEQESNYCKTDEYLEQKGCLSLSLPMTISGAAASPNGGYHTSIPLAFLMTVFNVRLGWWMQNTAQANYWRSPGPNLGLKYLFKELSASVDESSPFVYLSDGGHFENLGIYELVRRECRVIVACDAGADPNYEFEDLGNAIRKCYIDLGIRIDIDTSKIKPLQHDNRKGRSELNYAVGRIHYQGDKEMGVLLYIKSSMRKDEATDIEHYKAVHPDFPHDPTADQFFTESQFESYRKLGYTICRRLFNNIGQLDDTKKEDDSKIEMTDAIKTLTQYLGRKGEKNIV